MCGPHNTNGVVPVFDYPACLEKEEGEAALQHGGRDPNNCDHKYEVDGTYTNGSGVKIIKFGCKYCPASYERPSMV